MKCRYCPNPAEPHPYADELAVTLCGPCRLHVWNLATLAAEILDRADRRLRGEDPDAPRTIPVPNCLSRYVIDFLDERELNAFICPKCGAKSFHPKDKQEGYCARCSDFTGPGGFAIRE